MSKYKLAVLTSHPIQYQAPLFKLLAADLRVDLLVYFLWNHGISGIGKDQEFGKTFKWDIPLLDGYKYKVIKNYSPKPGNSLFGQINFGIIAELWKNRPNLLFVHGWNSIGNIFGILTAYALGIPVAMHGDNCYLCEAAKPRWKRILKRIILSVLLRKVYAVLYMGQEDRKFYEYHGVPARKLAFMPYSTDNDRLIADASRLSRDGIKKELGLEGKIVISFFGKLIERKRAKELLLAYERVVNEPSGAGSNAALVFVGDGGLRNELEEFAVEHKLKNVVFAGFKNLTELPAYYRLADVFAIPSFNECWGIVVNEAMCFSLPVVASDTVGSAPDLVKNGENGYIYKSGDVEGLARCLRVLVGDEKMRREFGNESLSIVKNYSFQKDAEAIIKVLETLPV